jgi:hypothetical protein
VSKKNSLKIPAENALEINLEDQKNSTQPKVECSATPGVDEDRIKEIILEFREQWLDEDEARQDAAC